MFETNSTIFSELDNSNYWCEILFYLRFDTRNFFFFWQKVNSDDWWTVCILSVAMLCVSAFQAYTPYCVVSVFRSHQAINLYHKPTYKRKYSILYTILITIINTMALFYSMHLYLPDALCILTKDDSIRIELIICVKTPNKCKFPNISIV